MIVRLATTRNLVALAFVVAHAVAALMFLRSFPNSWSWSELLIDYKGGFTKRGLIGAVAFLSRHAMRPQNLLAELVMAAYLGVTFWLVLRERMTERLSGLLFLFSPTGWLWPFLVTPAYGRKDVFVVAATAISLGSDRLLRRPAPAFAVAMAVFAVAGLIVEVAWFYAPLVLAGILWRRRDAPASERWRLALIGGAYCFGCLVVTSVLPGVDTGAIARSWAPAVRINDDLSSALCCLNFPLGTARAIASSTAGSNGGGFALAALFGAVPVALLMLDGAERRFDRHSILFMAAAAVFSTGPLFLAADFGRYIYLSLTVAFCSLWVGTRSAAPAAVRVATPANVLLIALYAGLWQTTHFQFPDRSAFVPGILFRVLGESFLPVGAD